MEIKQNVPNIELRSEEVQELMGKTPPIILRVGISVILVFVIFIYVASNFIKYPDTIAIPIIAKNVNYVTEIKAITSGQLVDFKMGRGYVRKGDILAKIVAYTDDEKDTAYVKSPFAGIIYPCDALQEKEYVDENEILCVIVDSIKEIITAKSSASSDLRKKIVQGMTIESYIGEILLQGKITSIADYANPTNGMYTITMDFENSKEVENMIIWNCHTFAKIKITERSVFDRFFKENLIPIH